MGRTITFLTAHDGFTLADLVSFNRKHNLANGEDDRDGDNHNNSWNHGMEGPSSDHPAVSPAQPPDPQSAGVADARPRGSHAVDGG